MATGAGNGEVLEATEWPDGAPAAGFPRPRHLAVRAADPARSDRAVSEPKRLASDALAAVRYYRRARADRAPRRARWPSAATRS